MEEVAAINTQEGYVLLTDGEVLEIDYYFDSEGDLCSAAEAKTCTTKADKDGMFWAVDLSRFEVLLIN